MDLKYDEVYSFEGDYVNGPAREVFTDFRSNSLIIKSHTGIGGTRAVLDYQDGNVLLICPSVAILTGKESEKEKYLSDKQFFRYFEAPDSWQDILNYLNQKPFEEQNAIIACTPDQIVKVKTEYPSLYKQLTKIVVFIDEIHSFTSESKFRDNMGRFMELVYNEWKSAFKLSTATPNYKNFDIPTDKKIKAVLVDKKDAKSRPIQLSSKYSDTKTFIYQELKKGNKVVVATNIFELHKMFWKGYISRNLVGKQLSKKLQAFKKGDDKHTDEGFWNADLFFLSSSYFTGFDVPVDCSICVVGKQKNDAHMVGVNAFVQAYGRCRKRVHSALYVHEPSQFKIGKNSFALFRNEKEIDDEIIKYQNITNGLEGSLYTGLKIENLTKDDLTDELYFNRTKLAKKTLGKIEDFEVHHQDFMISKLEDFGFSPGQFEPLSTEIIELTKGGTYQQRYLNLLEKTSSELQYLYKDEKENIKYGEHGSSSWAAGFQFLTAYILKEVKPEKLIDKLHKSKLSKKAFHNYLNNFIRVNYPNLEYSYSPPQNVIKEWERLYKRPLEKDIDKQYLRDWLLLYEIYRIRDNDFNPEIERTLKIYEIASSEKIFVDNHKDKQNRNTRVKRMIDQNLSVDGLTESLNKLEENKIEVIRKYIFKHFDDRGFYNDKYSRKALKVVMERALIHLLHKGQGRYAQKDIGHRSFGGITNLPKALRAVIPLKYVELDVSYANPSFVDVEIGSTIAKSVYENIMVKFGLNRKDAKTLYNYVLNAWYIQKPKATFMLMEFGYTEQQSKKLADLICGSESGGFYEMMTKKEKNLIESLGSYLSSITCIRLHDCLVIPSWEAAQVALPLNYKGFTFHVSYFNCDGDYDGWVVEKSSDEYSVRYFRRTS